MKISKIDFFRIQEKINNGEKPKGLLNKLSYLFSEHNSPHLVEDINGLSNKLKQDNLKYQSILEYFIIPKEYDSLFKIYGIKQYPN